MHNKKGQAALEFLMTYGWAILVVLVVIGALSYFGVLNPTNLLPEKCALEIGLDCTDYIVTDGGLSANGDDEIKIKLTNGRGKDVYITAIWVAEVDVSVDVDVIGLAWEGYTDAVAANNDQGMPRPIGSETYIQIPNGESQIFTLDCTGLDNAACHINGEDRKAKMEIYVKYFNQGSDSSMEHKMTGELLANIASP
ncbi:hypothetical protein K9M79_03325 [Candidatus Woesearchaeota archaeon]|nr:hypothetical protein [Candidatus Woesearchaeota archaeon]